MNDAIYSAIVLALVGFGCVVGPRGEVAGLTERAYKRYLRALSLERARREMEPF